MTFSFNIILEPWVSCLGLDGKRRILGIKDLLISAHELRSLEGDTPIATAAIYRFLLALLQRVYGPSDRSAWKQLWALGKWDPELLITYLDEWLHKFDLFDKKYPFYQVRGLLTPEKTINNLLSHSASGINPTLFDHATEANPVRLSPQQAAQIILATQSFSLAGQGLAPAKSFDAPAVAGINFIIQGNSLFETLCLNLVSYRLGQASLLGEKDAPAWEMDDPHQPVRSTPFGKLDYITWQSRKVLFLPELSSGKVVIDRLQLAPGLKLEKDDLFRDPMTQYRQDEKKGYLPLRFREGRALWRDSNTLLAIRSGRGIIPPEAVTWLGNQVYSVVPAAQKYSLLGLGLLSPPASAKVVFYRQENLPVPIEFLNPDGDLVDALEKALQSAEAVKQKLWGAQSKFATLLLSPSSGDTEGHTPDPADTRKLIAHWQVEAQYWKELEVHFYDLLESLLTDKVVAIKNWAVHLRSTAFNAFGYAERLAGNNTRALKAAVKAKQQLVSGIYQVLPELSVEKENIE